MGGTPELGLRAKQICPGRKGSGAVGADYSAPEPLSCNGSADPPQNSLHWQSRKSIERRPRSLKSHGKTGCRVGRAGLHPSALPHRVSAWIPWLPSVRSYFTDDRTIPPLVRASLEPFRSVGAGAVSSPLVKTTRSSANTVGGSLGSATCSLSRSMLNCSG